MWNTNDRIKWSWDDIDIELCLVLMLSAYAHFKCTRIFLPLGYQLLNDVLRVQSRYRFVLNWLQDFSCKVYFKIYSSINSNKT